MSHSSIATALLLLVQIDSGSAQTCPSTFLGSQNYIAASSAGTCHPSRSLALSTGGTLNFKRPISRLRAHSASTSLIQQCVLDAQNSGDRHYQPKPVAAPQHASVRGRGTGGSEGKRRSIMRPSLPNATLARARALFVFVVHTMNAMSGAMQLSRW